VAAAFVFSSEEGVMSEENFAAFTRRAAEIVSRRGSLLTLSSAALALGLTGPNLATAKRGKSNTKCKKQVSRCKAGLADLCDAIFPPKTRDGVQASGVPSECFVAFDQCCEFLQDCSVAQAFACAVDVVENLQTM
jgi:hypothetical protein